MGGKLVRTIGLVRARMKIGMQNLVYTGVTRGKRLVVLAGQKKAIAIAVRNVSGRRRWSRLNEWLASKTSASADHGIVR
jgi:ATP-dependent exoDNAse (exonuclease V) alpha subunit